jgi:hypothetical protein
VAAAAGDSGVLALQHVARLPVVELVVGWFPLDDIELRPQVLGMAADAILVSRSVLDDPGVETLPVCKPLLDFSVATGTLKLSGAQSKAVA